MAVTARLLGFIPDWTRAGVNTVPDEKSEDPSFKNGSTFSRTSSQLIVRKSQTMDENYHCFVIVRTRAKETVLKIRHRQIAARVVGVC